MWQACECHVGWVSIHDVTAKLTGEDLGSLSGVFVADEMEK